RLAREFEKSDLGRIRDVRTAAKLARKGAEIDDVHARAVLIAKEHQRAHFLRFFEWNVEVMNKFYRFAHFLVYDRFDLMQFFRRHFLEMAEIETQMVRRNERSGLVHMFTENFSQTGMHQVRCGMIPHDIDAAGAVDSGMCPHSL